MTASIDRFAAGRPGFHAFHIPWIPNLIDLIFVAITAALAVVITQAPMSGDYLQWLMVSRFYSGEDVPSYRDIDGVAPLVPALLALIRVPIDDPFTALNVLRVSLVAGLALGLYLAPSVMFHSRPAGLLSVVFAFSFTDRVFELFAFGGLLQVASLAFMLFGIAALGQAARTRSHERTWWTLASVAMSLAVFAHAGSTVIVVPVAVFVAVAVLARTWRRRSPAEWGRFLGPAIVVAIPACAYWLIVLAPMNQGYVENPAVVDFRGPSRLLEPLFTTELVALAIVAGSATILAGTAREFVRRSPGPYAMMAAWALGTWGLFGMTVALGIATDYPRFAVPLLLPVLVGVSVCVANAVDWLARTARRRTPGLALSSGAISLAVVGVVLLVWGREEAERLRTNDFYAVRDSAGLVAASNWIDEHLPAGKGVLVLEARDAKWIEGLTGVDALFKNQTRYSFRRHEWERSVAADAMVRSTTSMVNGLVSAKYMQGAPGSNEAIPRELLVGANHRGEWVDLLRLPEARATVRLAGSDEILVTLSTLDPVSVTRIDTPFGVAVRTAWSDERDGEEVGWVRTVWVRRDSNVVDVYDQVEVEADTATVELTVAPFVGGDMGAESLPAGALVSFAERGGAQPAMTVRLLEGDGTVVAMDDRLLVRASDPTRIHLQFEAQTNGAPISNLSLLFPHQLMEDYHIAAAILTKDGALEPRLDRLRALGLCVQLETELHVLLALDCASGGATLAGRQQEIQVRP